MKSEFETDFNGFKQQASEFFKRLKQDPTAAQIDGGLKALALAFLYMTGNENEKYQSEIVLQLAHRKAAERQM